jgi:ADP-ribose pyrophosphatase YjhB (NUDIX family)
MAAKVDDSVGGKPRKSKPKDAATPGSPPLKVGKRRKKALKRRGAKGWSVGTALLVDMMNSPPVAPALPDATPLQESGVLAFRRHKKGEPQILLIGKKHSKQWGIPKGRTVAHLSYAENAAKEAFEEAGVVGCVSPNAVGMFRAKKRSANPQVRLIVEVWVFLLEVTENLVTWPEKDKRAVKWVSCEAAARLLREPVLAHLCHRLAQS